MRRMSCVDVEESDITNAVESGVGCDGDYDGEVERVESFFDNAAAEKWERETEQEQQEEQEEEKAIADINQEGGGKINSPFRI